MIVILTNANSLGWHIQDIQRAAVLRGQQIEVCQWQNLTTLLGPCSPTNTAGETIWAKDICLSDAKVILPRSIGPGSLEQVVLRMDLLAQLQYQGVAVFNPQRAIEMAVDKYLSLANINRAGLPIAPTVVCQQLVEAMDAFEKLGGDVILKPLFGSEGIGMTRLSDAQSARHAFEQCHENEAVIYLQKFIQHPGPGGADLRLFVLGDRVLCAMRRTSTDDWRTNIAQGGIAEPYEPSDAERTLAIKAAAVCQTTIAGVDLLVGADGRTYVLEVNAIPGWRKLTEVTQVDVADEILAFVEPHLAC